MGVGTADAEARSTKANSEADASTLHCKSHKRRMKLPDCILTLLHQSARNWSSKDTEGRTTVVKEP